MASRGILTANDKRELFQVLLSTDLEAGDLTTIKNNLDKVANVFSRMHGELQRNGNAACTEQYTRLISNRLENELKLLQEIVNDKS